MKKLIILVGLFLGLFITSIDAFAFTPIMGPDVIYKSRSSMVTISDVVSLYSSYGNVITTSVDGYTGNGATLGTYEVILKSNDGINDIATKTVQIHVVESFGTAKIKLLTDNGNIYTHSNQVLTHQEIIHALALLDLIYYHPDTTTPYLIKDDYTQNASNPGYYQFQFRLIDLSGFDNNYQIIIYVSDTNSLLPEKIDMGGGGSNWISGFFSQWVIPGLVIYGIYWLVRKLFKNGSGRTIKPY